MADKEQPIVVKRVKKSAHGAHGGSWKVAYADFMTAMMAFFLLMWILQTATEEQKAGIAEYFTSGTVLDSSTSGGETILTGGLESLETAPAPQAMPFAGFDGSNEFPVSEKQERLIKKERELFDRARIALEEAMRSEASLAELFDSLVVSETREGLQIQLVDQLNQPIFVSGTDVLTPNGDRLTRLLARVLKQMPHSLAIEGHTDAVPFSGRDGYSNWELSSQRALAFRRTLIGLGIKDKQITRVVGKASTQPFLKKDPKAPQNRRISITLLSLLSNEDKENDKKSP